MLQTQLINSSPNMLMHCLLIPYLNMENVASCTNRARCKMTDKQYIQNAKFTVEIDCVSSGGSRPRQARALPQVKSWSLLKEIWL